MAKTKRVKTSRKRQDYMRERVIEAMRWLDQNAPGRAYEALRKALES